MRESNGIDKLTLTFATVMAFIVVFTAGTDAADRDWSQLAIGIVTGLFFVGLAYLVVHNHVAALKHKIEAANRDLENERRLREMDAKRQTAVKASQVPAEALRPEIPAPLRELMEALKPAMEHAKERAKRHEMLDAIIEDTGGLPLTEDRIAKVEAAYHDHTDEYVKLELVEDGKKISVEFSEKPIEAEEHVPGRSPAHEAARKRGDAARADKQPKKLSASQQRRINEQKGHGPITDAELREKKNAERRAKRAAKKAEQAATTTTTTTQPGQTSLV